MKIPALFAKFNVNPNKSQLVYALFVVSLIPLAIAANTYMLLKNVQNDMDFELNNKALLVETMLSAGLSDKLNDRSALSYEINTIVDQIPEIKAIELFTAESDGSISFATTSKLTENIFDARLNQLAWAANQPHTKQIVASLDNQKRERMWVIADTIVDGSGNRLGLINMYLSA